MDHWLSCFLFCLELEKYDLLALLYNFHLLIWSIFGGMIHGYDLRFLYISAKLFLVLKYC